MLEKITRLIKYCRNIHEGMTDVPAPFLVANEDQGTLVLNSPKREPRQIVISLPEATLIIFVLEKGKEQTRTQEQTDWLYLETLNVLQALLTKFINDICGANISGPCPLLRGMEFVEAVILPEAGRFGGWDGWAATLTLK